MSNVHIFDGLLNAFLNGREGPVAKELAVRGQKIANAAITNASGRPGPNVITGRGRSSIAWELGHDSQGLFVDVGSNVVYMYYLETGLRNGATYPWLMPALSAI